jgi:tetratricopeptide (TPR) repeat protein
MGSTTGSIKANIAIGTLTLCLLGAVVCGASQGQARAVNYNGRGGVGSTVSVTSLRIPEKAWRHFEKARSLNERNRPAEADVESQKAIAIAPDFAAAHLLLASVQVQEHSFLAALANVAEARRIEPDPQWSGVLLASAYNGLRRYAEAEAALDALHGDEARSWQSSYERARAAIGLGDVSGALRWSETALAGAPANFADAMVVRANSLVIAGRWSDAASQLEAYVQARGQAARRPEVLAAIEEDRRRARDEELRRVASR